MRKCINPSGSPQFYSRHFTKVGAALASGRLMDSFPFPVGEAGKREQDSQHPALITNCGR